MKIHLRNKKWPTSNDLNENKKKWITKTHPLKRFDWARTKATRKEHTSRSTSFSRVSIFLKNSSPIDPFEKENIKLRGHFRKISRKLTVPHKRPRWGPPQGGRLCHCHLTNVHSTRTLGCGERYADVRVTFNLLVADQREKIKKLCGWWKVTRKAYADGHIPFLSPQVKKPSWTSNRIHLQTLIPQKSTISYFVCNADP